jgi:glycosyltransferase involved in cell wall biosynthesis
MRILCVTLPNSGVGYHRQMMPLMNMADVYVLFTDFVNDEVLEKGFDIVMVNRFAYGVPIDTMLEYRKKYGFKLIVDIDDYWVLDPWHILYRTFPTLEVISHIKAADLVTCTHEGLRKRITPLNKEVEILPNALPYGRDQFTDYRIPGSQMSEKVAPNAIRFVYAGGVTHERDIAILKNPIKRIASDIALKKRLHFIICGYDDSHPKSKEAWHRMINDYLCGFKIPGYVRGPLKPEQYMAFYAEADATIAPLVPSPFNACKSNLKVLEAGAKKIPIIVSNTQPYDSCPYAIKSERQGDWYRHIKQIVSDDTYRQEMGMANHLWCVENHHLDKWNVVRNELYQSLL